MGRTAHCRPDGRALRSPALGDANRGVVGARGAHSGEPAAPTPRAAGFPAAAGAAARDRRRLHLESSCPVRTNAEPSTVRALGRAVAGALLSAVLRRASPERQGPGSERGLESVSRLAEALARGADLEGVARALLDELARLFDVGFVALTFVSDDGREAAGHLARARGEDVEWWRELRLDLEHEPSGIASAAFEAAAFAVYDTGSSGLVSRRLAQAVGAKSAAFVPLVVEQRVIGVLSVATLDEPRVFSREDLALMQTLASEAAVALERLRGALALQEALGRERLLASVARRLRSELDLRAALTGVAEETARALGASRCLVQLGEAGTPEPVAEWRDSAPAPPGEEAAERELAAAAWRERRSVVRAVDGALWVVVPLLGGERSAGVLSAVGAAERPWSRGDLALLEGVAAEIGLALKLARLLEENEARLAQQTALLRAAHALSGELDFAALPQRLADQLAQLLDADAADCYLLDPERNVLRCVAVHGRERSLVGFELPADQGLAGAAVREGRPLVAHSDEEVGQPVPHPAYAGFADAIVVPLTWNEGLRGVEVPPSASGTRRRSKRSPVSPRSPSATPRPSPRARVRHGSSAASTGSPRRSVSRSRGPRRWKRSPRRPPRRWAGPRPRCSFPPAAGSRRSEPTSCPPTWRAGSTRARSSGAVPSSGRHGPAASSSPARSATTSGCCPSCARLAWRTATRR